jgi:GWxTD domain-containing protein
MILGGVLLLAPVELEAQVEAARSQIDEERSSYAVDAISFAQEPRSKSRLDVFVQVGYEVLSFVKQGGEYLASYDMTIAIYDSASKLVSEKLWTEPVKVATFEQSVSTGAYSLTQRVFDVLPGRYYIATILRDNETKTSKRLLRQISVPDYSLTPVALSDIMLISRLTQAGERMNIVPSVTANVGDIADPFHIFFEAYSDSAMDSVIVEARVFDEKKEMKQVVDTTYALRAGKTQIFMSIDHRSLPVGDYTLLVNAYTPEEAAAEEPASLASTSRAFIVRWSGMPKTIKDLDLAIDQAQYIAKDNEVSYIKEASTPEEKQRRFLEFWKARDPNPNTPRNEKMEKYYERVEYANKHFTHYIEGWRTDMGMVFIMFGSPNNVDRHPFDIDAKPYEVWSYYQLNYSFVFVDQTGFGDYRLTTPIWEVWQRPAE